MRDLSERFWRNDAGATAIEYGLIVALIGVGIVASLTGFTNALTSMFETIADQVPN